MELLININSYVVNAAYFYQAIGFTISTSIFIGATIYNGDLSKLAKGLITLISYSFFLFLITLTRIYEVSITEGITDLTKAYAGVYTLIIVSLCYLFGMIIGVYTVKFAHRKNGKR